MKDCEYKDRVRQIENESAEKLQALAKEYAFSNSSVKVGDVVIDNIGAVLVGKIQYTSVPGLPQCVYTGIGLTRKLSPRKDGKKRQVWQSNVKEVIES